MSRHHTPTCPNCDAPLEDWWPGIGCPICLREYVVSVSEARPFSRINLDAPFAQLVLDADRLSRVHGRRSAA